MYLIEPMSLKVAQEISCWTYPDEYALYSFAQNEDTINELMNGEYFACLNSMQNLAGYFCYGQSARIPTVENGVYGTDGLDIGLGLKPELCGKGCGYAFMKSGMEYAIRHFGANNFRLTVACFNKRAVNLYGKLGFEIIREVTHAYSRAGFYVMSCVLRRGQC